MQRVAAVWHASPQKMVGVLFALLLAAAMAVGSGANFTTSSSNVGNMVTAGKLSMSNSKSGAIFTVNPMRPDDPAQSGTVQLSNTGDGPGAVTLTMANLVDTNTVNPASLLSTKLNLKVDEYTDATYSTLVGNKYNGLVSVFPGAGVGLGTWAASGASQTHYYKFSITWPGTANGGDNAFQGATSKMDFNWSMVQA
jgi:spore coat-associated protein N